MIEHKSAAPTKSGIVVISWGQFEKGIVLELL
jgi:hypothetical protein